MPIDDALEGIDSSGRAPVEKPVERTKDQIKPPYLLPVEKCLAVYQSFSRIEPYLCFKDVVVDTAELNAVFQLFTPEQRNFYVALRKGLDAFSSSLERLTKVYEGAVDPELIEDKVRFGTEIPPSLYRWPLQQAEVILSKLTTAADKVISLVIPVNIGETMELDLFKANVEQSNEILTGVYNERRLVEAVLLVRALLSHVDKINADLTIYQQPIIGRPPIGADKIVKDIQELESFAQGKTKIGYAYINGDFEGLTNKSPRSTSATPQRKKWWGLFGG